MIIIISREIIPRLGISPSLMETEETKDEEKICSYKSLFIFINRETLAMTNYKFILTASAASGNVRIRMQELAQKLPEVKIHCRE